MVLVPEAGRRLRLFRQRFLRRGLAARDPLVRNLLLLLALLRPSSLLRRMKPAIGRGWTCQGSDGAFGPRFRAASTRIAEGTTSVA